MESLPVRVVPWYVGHTQLPLTPLIQISEIFGVLGISFVMFYTVETLLSWQRGRVSGAVGSFCLLVVVIIVCFGVYRSSYFESDSGKKIEVALVQSAVASENSSLFELTMEAEAKGVDLIIWPERAFPIPLAENVRRREESAAFRNLTLSTNFMFGVESSRAPHTRFNSVFVLKPNGEVLSPYHKNELMPLGEYIPYVDFFPVLKKLNPRAGRITPGKNARVFPIETKSGLARIGPQVCYEEILAGPAISAVENGAEILVNVSSDHWFSKDQVIPFMQRLTWAAFRSVETRRYQLRLSDVGLTSVISPNGKVKSKLPIGSDAVLYDSVSRLTDRTIYSRVGDAPWQMLAIFSIGCLIYRLKKRLL